MFGKIVGHYIILFEMVHIYPKRTGVIGIMGQTDTKLRENGVIIQSVNVMRAWQEIGGKWR